MSDDKSQRAPQDASRVALSEEYEVRYWSERFGVSRERLEQAVEAVGNDADRVGEYLRERTA